MKELDATDRQLLALLHDNARQPLVALAKTVGLSRSAAQERLRRLERSGVIQGYGVRLARPDAPVAQAWLAVRFAPGFSCEDIVPRLREIDAVRLCHSVAGETDLMILLGADSLAVISELRERVAAMREVDAVTTLPVLDVKLDRL